jgi:proteasome lid subunit RPN8/RPN11
MVLVTRIVVDKEQENNFRRRALRAMPDEYIETLYGYVDGSTAYICAFVDCEHEGTPAQVTYDDDELDSHEHHARKNGLELLGTIHSHPDREDPLYSHADARDCFDKKKESLFGICAISITGKRRKCNIAYWPAVQPLPVIRKHYEGRRAKRG